MFLLCLLAAVLFQQSSALYTFVAYTALDWEPDEDLWPDIYQCKPPSAFFEFFVLVEEVEAQLLSDWQDENPAVTNLTINCVYRGINGAHIGEFIVQYTVEVAWCDFTIPTIVGVDIGDDNAKVSYNVTGTYILGGRGPCLLADPTTTTPTPTHLCNGKTYDPASQTCCFDLKIYTTKPNFECCGRKYFDDSKYQCCGEMTVYNPTIFYCCGTRKLRSTGKYICCNNKVFAKKKWKCCHGNPDFPWPKDWDCPSLINGENPTFSQAYCDYFRKFGRINKKGGQPTFCEIDV